MKRYRKESEQLLKGYEELNYKKSMILELKKKN